MTAHLTKSAAELNNIFAEKVSFILRANTGGKAKGKSAAAARKAAKGLKPLWDPKSAKVGDFFTCISYLKVTNIEGDKITVKN